ncbi:ketoacyl-ACP synthase III [Flavobacterium cheonanense]|jgi:3-oxoacyl-[acyl-carrier-protein] synthase-3|uniref:Ketoacyl-ACP synthase III n=1 Tax=Flavobacterium cheonanense TaxID=706183 RepID=A0ABP7W5T6_9FLAO
MILSKINKIKISGVSVALPTKLLESQSYYSQFGKENVDKFIEMTGVGSVCRSVPEQTASDLGYLSAKRLINERNIDVSEIGLLIFVSQKPDYRTPASSYIIHERLNLSENCMCFDINLACSGFLFGLQTAMSLLNSSNSKKALLITADTSVKTISEHDRTMIMLFGDSGSTLLLEKTDETMQTSFGVRSDGNRFKSIITPSGAYRNLNASDESVSWSDGIIRSDYNTHMKGMEVFGFSISDVPKLISDFLIEINKTPENFDHFVLHQANLYILKQLSRKNKIPMEKIPISLDRYGNNSSNSIPLVLADHFSATENLTMSLFFSGFGAGLSWACADVVINTNAILPILFTDEYDLRYN